MRLPGDKEPGADIDPLHVSMSEWTGFVAAIKAGRHDDVGSSQTSC